MEKYRIVVIGTSDISKPLKYYIKRKKFWGWRFVEIVENNRSKYLEFNSLGEAEIHMFKNYFRFGEVYQPRPNEYWYTKHTYYY